MKTVRMCSFILGGLLCLSTPAFALFDGDYVVSNWTTTFTGPLVGTPGTPGEGSVDTSGAPNSIKLIGADDGLFGAIENVESNVDFTINILGDGMVMFDWDYETMDVAGPSFDPFGYLLNNVFFPLTDDGADSQSGWESVDVELGNIFGFRQHSTDSSFGLAMTTISKFSGPGTNPVPEPSTMILLGTGLVGLVVWKRKKAA